VQVAVPGGMSPQTVNEVVDSFWRHTRPRPVTNLGFVGGGRGS
jgi:hypothetical protein